MEWFMIYFDDRPSTIAQSESKEKIAEDLRIANLGKELPPMRIESIWDVPREDVIMIAVLGLVDTVGKGMAMANMRAAAMAKHPGKKH